MEQGEEAGGGQDADHPAADNDCPGDVRFPVAFGINAPSFAKDVPEFSLRRGVGALSRTDADITKPAQEAYGQFIVENNGLLEKTVGGRTTIEMRPVFQTGGDMKLNGNEVEFKTDIPLQIGAGSVIDHGGGILLVDGGVASSGGQILVGTGTLTVTGAIQYFGGEVQVAGGTVSATGDYTLGFSASLIGWGTITADVHNGGHLYVGDVGSSGGTVPAVGTLAVNGDYTQTEFGTLHMDIAGTTSYDRLNVSGLATFGGSLYVALLNGFEPSVGDVYSLVNFGSWSGDPFEYLYLPGFAGGYFDPRYNDPVGTFSLWALELEPPPPPGEV